MKVKCVSLRSDSTAGLTEGNLYQVIAIEGSMVRLINDFHEPVLYDANLFRVVDREIPNDWEIEVDDYCQLWYEPKIFTVPGFWIDVWNKLLPNYQVYVDWLTDHNIPYVEFKQIQKIKMRPEEK